LLLVAAITALTYATRYAGFVIGGLGGRVMPSAVERFLPYVPIAAFAALVAPGVADGPGALSARAVAIGTAALVGLRFKRLWASLILGMAAFWLVDLILGSVLFA